MTHKLIPQSLNLAAAMVLMAGISVCTMQVNTYAQLSGMGSSAGIHIEPGEPQLIPAVTTTYVNGYQTADAGIQLILGMLLIVLGFFVHGLARSTQERAVHITIAPPKPKNQHKWFWMEMQI